MTGLAQLRGLERGLGMAAGHDATVAFVEAARTFLELTTSGEQAP